MAGSANSDCIDDSPNESGNALGLEGSHRAQGCAEAITRYQAGEGKQISTAISMTGDGPTIEAVMQARRIGSCHGARCAAKDYAVLSVSSGPDQAAFALWHDRFASTGTAETSLDLLH